MAKPRTREGPVTNRQLASFHYTKLVIIESLGETEVSTGRELGKYLSSLDSFVDQQASLEICDCQTAESLKDLLERLTKEARALGARPMLHFECHGTLTGDGLYLANGETIRWTELAPLIEELNLATEFNVLLFLAACNAFYFIEEMSAIRPSPVYAFVAPSDEVDPAEVMRGARDYYRTLFDTGDAGIALKGLVAEKLSNGSWYGRTAEEWFEQIVTGYVETHCSSKAMTERARKLYQSQPSATPRKSVGSLKRGLRRKHDVFVQEYFQEFFNTVQLPGNLKRFDSLRRRVEQEVKSILASPEFRT